VYLKEYINDEHQIPVLLLLLLIFFFFLYGASIHFGQQLFRSSTSDLLPSLLLPSTKWFYCFTPVVEYFCTEAEEMFSAP
jgi:hypothetical protein